MAFNPGYTTASNAQVKRNLTETALALQYSTLNTQQAMLK